MSPLSPMVNEHLLILKPRNRVSLQDCQPETKFLIQVEIRFLSRVSKHSLCDGVRSSEIQRTLKIKLLLLQIEDSVVVIQASHKDANLVVSMGSCSGHISLGTRPQCRPRTPHRNYNSQMVWDHLGLPHKDGGSLRLWKDRYGLKCSVCSLHCPHQRSGLVLNQKLCRPHDSHMLWDQVGCLL